MALIHPAESPMSVATKDQAYHRVVRFQLSAVTQTIEMTIGTWEDKAARDAGKQAIGHRDYVIGPEPQPEVTDGDGNVIRSAVPSYAQVMSSPEAQQAFGTAFTLLYDLLKTFKEFEGAVNG